MALPIAGDLRPPVDRLKSALARLGWLRQQEDVGALLDGTIVDFCTPLRAWAVGRSHMWSDALGRSLWYSVETGLKPGVVLVRQQGDDPQAYWKCRLAGSSADVATWIYEPENERLYADGRWHQLNMPATPLLASATLELLRREMADEIRRERPVAKTTTPVAPLPPADVIFRTALANGGHSEHRG